MKGYNFIFILYFFFCLMFLNIWGINAIEEKIDFEFFADSETYMLLYNMGYSISELIALNWNLIGPLMILKIFSGNFYLVFLLNMLVLYVSFYGVIKNYQLNNNKFLLLIILSPLMIGSVIGINKEIFSFLVISLLLQYNANKKLKYLILGVLLSILVRWQMTLVCLIFAFITSPANPFRKNRLKSLLIMIIGVSVIYPLNISLFEHVDNVATLGASKATEGSGLYSFLISIQNQLFGYCLVFIPKALFLFGGLVFRFQKMLDFSDLYNNLFVFSQSVFNLLLLYIVIKRKQWLSNDFVYFAFIYLIVFCISPIFAPRYLIPVTLLFICTVSQKKIL
ncbi:MULTISPECIES: hypothetical protein [unclassified Sphingobacterium]|uniref:hypothetical protein n=1 Tax=unclassified Sphingobacterium TaxID=2609468 RepID=UPI0010499116|nr:MULTISPECIES: hypothetical protein [unclassified Sphingobacterium]MCS3555839.1 hypothetical protein [Sphingobacterium sp. JUb21]TCR00708.1 hypothetical protein EDF66_11117 [Sphingobacterium sp. JUb20]